MKSKTFLATSLAMFATFVISSCGRTAASVTSVSILTAGGAATVSYQSTLQLTANVEGTGEFNKKVSWSVSDEELASISEDGLLTSVTEEDAYVVVTATSMGDATKSATVDLLLYGKPTVTGVAVSDVGLTLINGQKGTAEAQVRVRGTGEDYDGVSFAVADESIATVDEDGVLTAQGLGSTTLTVTSTLDTTKKDEATVTVSDAANGYYNYTKNSADERTDILGALEKYAVDTKLIGLPIYGDGGYAMYASNIVKGSNTYIPGYGFGILAEGSINADLPGETVQAYKRYYHTYETDDPGTLLYMNDKGSVVGDLVAYVAAGYFDVKMNDTKDGYDWFGDLALTDRPEAVDPDEFGFSKTFRFPVKVGADLKYSTNTSVARLSKYNNQEVALEDYITPYKIYYTQSYGLKRSSENLSGASSLKGTKTYYDSSADGFNANAWEKVGIKAYVDEEDGLSYLEFTFNNECSPFYAMYYLSSGMFAPVPQQFILDCAGANNTDLAAGVKVWASSDTEGREGPADHYLATGPYMVEAWNTDQNIVFKKNPNYADHGRYQIAGIHVNIFPAAGTDENAVIEEFLDGKLSATGIPQDYLATYKNDPRAVVTGATSVYKLNVNQCDAELWEQLFGTEGSITKTPKSSYWEVEPAMSVPEFIEGINYSLNRVQIAETHGRSVGYTYFADSYMSDPENGVSYNSTKQHEDAIADFVKGTDGYGYSLELARSSFRAAAQKLLDEGIYDYGDTIEVEIAWQTTAQAESYAEIPEFIEKAFNSANTGLKLDVVDWVGAVWSDVYYSKMMIGQFDIGFGSISGNSLNPINFLEVLKSDNSSGFTLNWGVDTSEVDGRLVYDGHAWSFNSLWEAADQGGVFEDSIAYEFEVELTAAPEVVRQQDGSLKVYLYVDEKSLDEDNGAIVYGICLFATTDGENYSDYAELYVVLGDDGFAYDEENGCYIFTFSAEDINAWLAAYPVDEVAVQGFDLYIGKIMAGELRTTAFYDTIWVGLIPDYAPEGGND